MGPGGMDIDCTAASRRHPFTLACPVLATLAVVWVLTGTLAPRAYSVASQAVISIHSVPWACRNQALS